MEIVAIITSFFANEYVSGLLINLLSSWMYDKRSILTPKIENDEQLARDLAEVLKSTFRRFYAYKEFSEYDSDIVLNTFCKEYSALNDTVQKGNVRRAIELTIDLSISDDDFARWAEYFRTYYVEKPCLYMWITSNIGPNPSTMYYDDDIVFCRVEAKLLAFDKASEVLPQHSMQIDSIFEKINERYWASWKNDVLTNYAKLTPLPSFFEKIQEIIAYIRSNEECDLVLAQLKNLLSMYDPQKSNREAYRKIQDFLRYPRYDMLQIISGTSGSGKSSWIEQYFRFSLAKDRIGALSVIPVMISCQTGTNADQFKQVIHSQISSLLGQNYTSQQETNKRLQMLGSGVKICFIIEDIHIALNQGLRWSDVVSIIEEYSCFDSFKWMITINEYELFLLETNQSFLKKYCITLSECNGVSVGTDSFSKYALSLDVLNHNWKIVREMLNDKLGIDTTNQGVDLEKSISTPMEAKIFCECLGKEDLSMVSLPSTYFGFFTTIAEQKNKQMQNFGVSDLPATIDQVANTVLSTRRCVIDPKALNSEHLAAIRNTQLLIRTAVTNDDVYSPYYMFQMEHYHLSTMAYWARIIAGKLPIDEEADISIVSSFPLMLSEWLIPCYIFRYVDNKDILSKLLPTLRKNNLLDYALFLARRTTDWYFSKDLLEYILKNQDCIRDVRDCYAVLYFVNYSGEYLSIPEKFNLLMAVSKAVESNGMLDIYERVFRTVVVTSGTCKKLKKNMLLLSAQNLPNINYINGYITAGVFMGLWENECSDYEELFHEYAIYLFEHKELIALIDHGSNESFMDYFIRKCMEEYIYHTSHKLTDVYSILGTQIRAAYEICSHKQKSIKGRDVAVIRHFYDRNFTCAAGNVFTRKGHKPTNYDENYVSAVETLIQSNNVYRKKTAWHLLSNSKKDKSQALDIELQKYAEILEQDPNIQKWLELERSKRKY